MNQNGRQRTLETKISSGSPTITLQNNDNPNFYLDT
jgi:hypothetical protein